MASIVKKTWKRTEIGRDGKPREVTRIGWQAQVRLKGHKATTETFETKTAAKDWAQKTEAAMKEGRHFPERASRGRTLADLIERYVRDVCLERDADGELVKKGGPKTARQLAMWRAEHGFRVLAELTPEVIAEARDKLCAKVLPSGRRIAGATVNRYMAALSTALTTASREWRWISNNPMRQVKKKGESRGRVRMLSDAEREKLLQACRESGAGYLESVVILALATGMRQGEILGLRWPAVDLARARLVLHDTKNGERRGVALVGPALATMRELAKVRLLDNDRVFPGTSSFRAAWGRAVKKAKVLDFRFHDLRHTAASYLAMNGASPSEIAAVLGHKTLAMVKRYAHLHDAHVEGVLTRMAERFMGDVKPATIGRPAVPVGEVVPIGSRRAKRAAK